MASFNQDVRTNNIVLNGTFPTPHMPENFTGSGSLDILNIPISQSCSSNICDPNGTPGLNVVYSSNPSSTVQLAVSNMCAPTTVGSDPTQDPSKKIASSYEFPSPVVQAGNFTCDANMYPGGQKYPLESNTTHTLLAVQHSETYITVPFGWKRVISSGKVIYISPSEIYLHSLQEIAVYLQTEGTCKCGLECPLMLNKVFNFNPMASTKCWTVSDLSWNDPTKLCNHKRKIVAMATFRNSTLSSLAPSSPLMTPSTSKKDSCLTNKRKRLKGKNKSPFDSVLVSQLLAQRDKLGVKNVKSDLLKSFDNSSQQLKIRNATIQKSEAPNSMLHTRFPMVDPMQNSPKPIGFVPLEEQGVPILNKMNTSANFNTLHMNQNFFVPDNVFHGKRLQDCVQQFQQCNSENSNSAVMFHKHINSSIPCVVQDQTVSRNPEALYTDRVPPLPSADHQTFGPGVFNPQQFLHNNNIPANITLNCNFPSPNVGGQVFSTQLPVNQCIDINSHNQSSTEIVTTVSQSSNPGAFLFHADVQNNPNQPVNNIITNFINPACGQVYPVSSQDSHLPVVSPLRYTASREDNVGSRQKPKKSKAKISKLNTVLDRCSPCPNIDVRQIPSEHHRPPPEAFAAIGSTTNCLTSMGTVQTSNYQIVPGNSLSFSAENLNLSYLNKPLVSVAGQNLTSKSRSPGNFFEITKTVESNGSNSSSPYPGSPVAVNNFQPNSFQSYQDISQLHQTNNSYTQENCRNQNKMLPPSVKISQINQSLTTSLPHSVTPASKMQSSIGIKSLTDSVTEKTIQTQNVDANSFTNISHTSKSSSSEVKYPDNSVTYSQNFVITSSPVTTVNSPLCSTQFKNINSTLNLQPFDSTSSHSNVINNMSFSTSQSHVNNVNVAYTNQNLHSGTQQLRQNLSVPQQQQPVIYNNALPNPPSHRPEAGNFFMQNTANPAMESMTTIRPSLVQQDGPGVLVQQVLSQKISQDYPNANIFSSTARAQVVQQVSGMVLPQSASNSNINSQQLVITPQMRMSASGGLITMLPPAITSNAMMNGTQVITGPPQQMGPQMVIPENIRPNIVNHQQQILQNNCFIMSNQPAFVTRPPHTNIVSSQVPCQTSVSLSFSNGTVGNFTSQQNTSGGSIITGPLIQKAPDRNEITSQNINSDLSLQTAKDQNPFAAGFHVLQPTQRLQGQKSEGSIVGQDWLHKADIKSSTSDQSNQVTGFLSNISTSRSNSVPSNLPGHAMLSNCGQVLISGDNGCLNPQTVSASNISRMTSVIPIVGGQCGMNSPMPPLSVPNVTAVTTTMTQMIPAIGIAPQILGQPVQPMVQVINTVPFNSMQNAVIVPGGSNVLSQTVRLDTLQTSPVVGPPAPTVFNSVVLPPNTVNCVPPPPVSNVSSLRHPHSTNHEEMRITVENIHEARGTPSSSSSYSNPASSNSTPVTTTENHNITFRALSPAVRKRTRDGKRKTNTQTVASMLQNGAHNASAANANNTNSVSQQQQQQQIHQNTQISSLQQQFLQPPMLQTLTVLPQQPRPLLQQPVMNYNSISSVGGHQILTGLTSPLGLVQPLSMLGVTPTGTVIQNIPVQQVVPGPHFQSLTVLQGPHTMNSLPQEQPVVVNDTSSMGVHPTQMHSAFAAGSIVPNMVSTNPVISTHVGGTEVLVTATSQSHAVPESISQTTVPPQFPSIFPQALPPVAQSLSSTTCSTNVKVCKSGATTTCNATSLQGQNPINTSFVTPITTNITVVENKEENLVSSTNESFPELSQKARSIGVQSNCTEQNAAVQTVTSTVPVSNICMNSLDDSQNTKLSLQDSLDETKSKFEGENSSTILSSGGESCESPWPDPVNLSAAVRAVVQEQVDSNEEIISHPVSSSTQIVNFMECNASIHEETSEETPTSSVDDIVEESNDGNSVLDLRTMSLQSGEFSAEQDVSEETNCEVTCEEADESLMHLNNWNKDQLPVAKQNESSDNVGENASTASSETSEQTSTDCNVTSDSGVESSQEPMNLACIREDNVDAELPDLEPPSGGTMSLLNSYEGNSVMNQSDDLLKKRGVKRLRRELDVSFDGSQDDDSDDGTPQSPELPPQPRTFNDGELVWGQIRGFPSWPGKLVREEEVKGIHKSEDGKLWVKWFGDHTFTQVEPDKLKTLSEGLEAHHRARKRHRRGRKMNTQLENAIQEAMLELDRQSAEMLTDETEDESFLTSNISISDSNIPPVSVRTNKTRVYKRR